MHWTSGVALHNSMTNITVVALIERAFGVGDYQVFGDPKWVHSKRYDIEADIDESLFEQLRTLPADQQLHELQLMERSLLADRFKLQLTHQTKELPVVKLTVTKDVWRLGPPAEQAPTADANSGITATVGSDGEVKLMATKATIDNLANVLSRILGQVVENDTGIKGYYTFTVTWSDAMLGGSNAGSGPSLQTALGDDLGLRVESTKGPVDTILIDHIEEPSPN